MYGLLATASGIGAAIIVAAILALVIIDRAVSVSINPEDDT